NSVTNSEKFCFEFQKILISRIILTIMIDRTILELVEECIGLKAVTLITGARQVGKTTLCKELVRKHGFNYVSLAEAQDREEANADPLYFLKKHTCPLIIDEVQRAPALFDYLEAEVDRKMFETDSNEGMYVLTGSQAYALMQGVTQSMAGRLAIVEMSPLSLSEIIGRPEVPFLADIDENISRGEEHVMSHDEVFSMIVRGMYPELYQKPQTRTRQFYSDYVQTYIARDISQMINVRDKTKFLNFMSALASLTGQELVYDNVASDLGIDSKTVKSWTSILVAGGIIRLIQPYVPGSNMKSVKRRPKMYFCDTGLACYLSKIDSANSLDAHLRKGHMVETFIVNEIIKTYTNRGEPGNFYYFRDKNMNEIDLIIVKDGKMHLIECKTGMMFTKEDVKSFDKVSHAEYEIGPSCIVCLTDRAYSVKEGVRVLPVTSI
ncbi:MAG: ATP-binding protein, partial [Thermoplasmata archaeon]|nr:ATP-binding protein [Thermoplasmata archaeon]